MKKFALLAVVALFVAADAAQAGVFRRGGGCPGGVCGVNLAAAPAPAPAVVEAPKPEAPKTEVAGTPAETTQPAVAATTQSSERFARTRVFGRRR